MADYGVTLSLLTFSALLPFRERGAFQKRSVWFDHEYSALPDYLNRIIWRELTYADAH